MKSKLYGFQKADADQLIRLARSSAFTPPVGSALPGMMPKAGSVGSWIVEATTSITAPNWGTSTPGSGTVKIKTVNSSGVLTDHLTDASATVTRTAYNLFGHALPSGALLQAERTLDGNLWLVQWLDKPSVLCRFTAGAAFTTSSSTVSGTIASFIGWGKDHASTSATFNNLLTATASTYLFEGSSGAAGLAFYTGSGTTWQIIQMECP